MLTRPAGRGRPSRVPKGATASDSQPLTAASTKTTAAPSESILKRADPALPNQPNGRTSTPIAVAVARPNQPSSSRPNSTQPKPSSSTSNPAPRSIYKAAGSASATKTSTAKADKPKSGLKMPAYGWDKEVLKRTELRSVWEQGKLKKSNDWNDGVGPVICRDFAIQVEYGKWVPGRLNREPSPASLDVVTIDDDEDVTMSDDEEVSDGDPPMQKRLKTTPPTPVAAKVVVSLPDLPEIVEAALETALKQAFKKFPPTQPIPTPAPLPQHKPDSAAAYYAEIDARLAAQKVTVKAPSPLPHNTTLPIPKPYTGLTLTESQVKRKAAAITHPVKHKRTLVASNIAVPNLTITIWDCPSLHPILACAVPNADPLAPAPRMLTPLAVKHLTFDSEGQPMSGPRSRSTWRFHLKDDWFAERALLELRLEGGPTALEQAARGESWMRESIMRLERGMEQVYCLVKSGSLEWSARAE